MYIHLFDYNYCLPVVSKKVKEGISYLFDLDRFSNQIACFQMGSGLNSCYLYSYIKLPEGCLREFRNITVCSECLCDSIPDSLFEVNNSRNSVSTHSRLAKTYYNLRWDGNTKINVFEPHHPYEPLKESGEVKSLLDISLCTLW